MAGKDRQAWPVTGSGTLDVLLDNRQTSLLSLLLAVGVVCVQKLIYILV
jgi:hypothetical protein